MRTTLHVTAIALAFCMSGCSSGPAQTDPHPVLTVTTPPSPAVPAPSAAAAPAAGAPQGCAEPPPQTPGLIVASDAGVMEVSPEGRVLRTITRTRATLPRFLPGRREIVFLVPERGELRRLSLDTCAERVVATLPRDIGVSCKGIWSGPYDPVTYIHADEDFVVDPRGELCCARVMDRNLNMSNVHVILQVRLSTGEQAQQVAFPDTCAAAPPKSAEFACARVLTEVHPPDAKTLPGPATQALPFSVADARKVPPARGVGPRTMTALKLTEPQLESASPSGRWAVLSGNREEADYIYRKLYLFDRQTGQVFPLREGPWPPPFSTSNLANEQAIDQAGLTATGETAVRWIGGGDTLLVGGLLIEPMRHSMQLKGALAW